MFNNTMKYASTIECKKQNVCTYEGSDTFESQRCTFESNSYIYEQNRYVGLYLNDLYILANSNVNSCFRQATKT